MSDIALRKPGRPSNAEIAARRLAVVEESAPIPDLSQPRRWQIDDLDPWLLERINFRWPEHERVMRGLLTNYAASNEFLLITNGEAVLLAETKLHAMSRKIVVMEVFAFCREANVKDGVYGLDDARGIGGAALRALYRQLREWAKSMSATRVYVGVCSDLTPSILREIAGATSYYVVGATC
jgi:hypothetical protein